MKRAEAKVVIKENWRDILYRMTGPAKQKVNGEDSYICPLCGHGNGGDGIAHNPKSKDPGALHCFGCDFSGDIIALYQAATGKDFNEALDSLTREAGVEIDQGRENRTDNKSPRADNKTAENENKSPWKKEEPEKDYTGYYQSCQDKLQYKAAKEYLEGRGISYETAEAAGIGFDPEADPANAPGATGNEHRPHPTPRIIIPNGKGQYLGRSIDPTTEKKYQKMNSKKGTAGLFNLPALYAEAAGVVIVTEGAFDALSFMEIGFPAIALNSTGNKDKLLKELENRRTDNTLVICLDNDAAGEKAAADLAKGLDQLNICYICPAPETYLPDGCKDANEALTASRSRFTDDVAGMLRKATKPDSVAEYMQSFMLSDMDNFREEKRTGFPLLDAHAGGGLYPGLYAIGAVSSLGKTTFMQQTADQLAAKGYDVIFFSLEQSRLEMVTKSLARRIRQQNKDSKITSLQIRKGLYTEEVSKAMDGYAKDAGDRISIIEGNFSCNAAYISGYVRRYIRENRVRPVVIVDYLQILQPGENDKRQSMREIVDSTVTELKRLSRELDITVIVISSVNRANYLSPIDFESFKESGGIEYTADVVWGLQLQCLNEEVFNQANKIKEKRERVKEAKAENPRKIELVCLKNRYGVSSFSSYFDYYPDADLFIETTGELEVDGWEEF